MTPAMRRTVLTVGVLFVASASAQPLSPADVRTSVERHHPTVAAAVAREEAARAELRAARGGFDPQLRLYGSRRAGGYYELTRLDVELRQPTPLWGAEVWAGYRRGAGAQDRYPTYYADETLSGGEVRAGLRVPLWREGPLDARRAARERARLAADAAGQRRRATALDLRRRGLVAYWKWVAAGRQLRVASALLQLASARRGQVERRAASGVVPPIEVLEAERSLLRRRSTLVTVRRAFEGASLALSLYLRDDRGAPLRPDEGRLPGELALPSIEVDAGSAVQRALACHPRLRAARATVESRRVQRELARARRGPQLDLSLQVSRDFGRGDESLAGTVYEGGLRLAMPLGLRTARGELDGAEAALQAAEQELRLREDVLATEIRDVASAWAAARERFALARALAETTRRLAEAERRRFESGATSLLVVNLREQAAAEASIEVVEAARDLWIAAADWEALTWCEASED